MEKQVKRIGVLTSGGDAPGMNAAVRAVVRTAICKGVECVGIRRGWNGLINSDFFPMNAGSVSHIIDKGGTILYTARSEEFREPSGRAKARTTRPSQSRPNRHRKAHRQVCGQRLSSGTSRAHRNRSPSANCTVSCSSPRSSS